MLITPSPAADGLLEASSSTLLCCLRLHESACGGKSLTAWPIGLRGVVYETAGRLGTVEPAGALRRLGRVCTEGVAAAAWRRRQHGLRVAISFRRSIFGSRQRCLSATRSSSRCLASSAAASDRRAVPVTAKRATLPKLPRLTPTRLAALSTTAPWNRTPKGSRMHELYMGGCTGCVVDAVSFGERKNGRQRALK
jgi:hypothetical protein